MKKKVWITALSRDKNPNKDPNKSSITKLLQTARRYGLAADGHFWVDDLPKAAWQAPLEPLLATDTALWVIAGSGIDLEAASVRYGLSLLALSLQHDRGVGFPILLVCPDGTLDADRLATPFRSCDVLKPDSPSLGPKMTALANTPIKNPAMPYRIDIHTGPGIGVWYELGPAGGMVWNGVLAGGRLSEVNAHGVGPKGRLPLKTTLEYPMQGLKLTLGEDAYTAWAVKNAIDDDLSYYVRFSDLPGRILFGPLPGDNDDQADFHVMDLC